MDGHPVDPSAGRALNLLPRDAVVEYIVAGTADPRGHHALIINLLAMPVRHSVVVGMVTVEIIPRNKTVTTGAQTKSEAHANSAPPIGKSNTRAIPGTRRKWGPAAISIRVSPTYPGRPPNCVRVPAPTEAIVTEPSAIMERSPTPAIV